MKKLHQELERIYDQFSQSLYSYALNITKNRELAEDAIQQAFYRLMNQTEMPKHLKVYVFRSVRNACIDLIRKENRSNQIDDRFIFEYKANPRDQAADEEFIENVIQAMAHLSEDERETIVQHLYAELTFREISEIRDVSINTAMSWYRRGIEKLQKYLEEHP